MKTKQEWLYRKDDIDVGIHFNAMRLRQRELSWPDYVENCACANVCFNGLTSAFLNYQSITSLPVLEWY